jgi:hypothetical protein
VIRLAPLQDVINEEGDIVVGRPALSGLIGLFGDPDTTDNLDGSWDHEFASGGDDLPSYTIEIGMAKVPAFFRHAGVKLNSMLNAAKKGSGPSAAGTSSRAEGPNTAEPAATTTCPAPEANREPTEDSAPIGSMP